MMVLRVETVTAAEGVAAAADVLGCHLRESATSQTDETDGGGSTQNMLEAAGFLSRAGVTNQTALDHQFHGSIHGGSGDGCAALAGAMDQGIGIDPPVPPEQQFEKPSPLPGETKSLSGQKAPKALLGFDKDGTVGRT